MKSGIRSVAAWWKFGMGNICGALTAAEKRFSDKSEMWDDVTKSRGNEIEDLRRILIICLARGHTWRGNICNGINTYTPLLNKGERGRIFPVREHPPMFETGVEEGHFIGIPQHISNVGGKIEKIMP